MARNGKIRSKLNHNKIKEIVAKTQATCSTCVLAINGKIRLNHNEIKEIVEKSQATCSKCLKQVNGAVEFCFRCTRLHYMATIAANGFWDIFTKKGIDIKKTYIPIFPRKLSC